MNLTTFATQLETEAGENYDELVRQFPSELDTAHGVEPCLDWGEFIISRIDKAFPSLSDDAKEELLEDMRSEICV